MSNLRSTPIVSLSLAAIALAALAPGAACAEEKVPLKVELPPPLFVGTPVPVQLPQLEKPTPGKRPDLMVPVGTKLLSRKRPVTSSDEAPIMGEARQVTDGNKSGADGECVEFGPGLQWVQIDLGAPARVAAIAVWHFHSEARVYHDVIVQVSDDPAFKRGVHTVFNNDDDNSARMGKGSDPAYIETNEGRLIDAQGAKGRYVRLYSNGNTSNDLNEYCEVEVFGTPEK
ncbi:discoidin domain-containing protein [Opitutus sp. ER46]|uniref:discoidin domain-containing protein n=1 Tax=Opitutus sp. ER46 TaxID=2161864 RepID=UPI000D31612C|nr:discoidin domain-containing protein [Opitutus sp. ER46]PTX95608.1 hypothetical protein DB354_09330 [Opitutus sp. ER46]